MRTSHRRATLTTIVPVLAALVLTACGGAGSTSGGGGGSDAGSSQAISAVTAEQLKGTTIQLARFFGDCTAEVGDNTDLSKAVGECRTIQTLTNKFNAENKYGIKVERLGGAAWDSYYDTLNAAFAGGNPPDVAIMHASSLVDYAQRKLLLPLDDLVGITGTDLADAAPAAKQGIAYDGKNYAVPFDLHAALAHLNVDLFTQAGLVNADGTPKLPTSPEEFFADAATMKAKTGKNYFGVARVGDNLGVHVVNSLIMQQGSSVLTKDLTAANVDTPEARNAIEFMNKVFADGYADGNQTYDAAQQAFLGGDTAMLVNGTWVVDQYNKDAKFTYEATNFPTLYKDPAVWADSHTWVIPQHKDADPVRYRAALEFINYLYQNDQAWALGTGHIAARESVLNSAEYAAAPQRANYVDTGLTVAHLVPHIGNWPAVQKALVQTVESIWFQGDSVDQALKNGNSAVDAALKGSG